MKFNAFAIATALSLASLGAQAVEIVVQWDFNSATTAPQLKPSYTYNGEQSPSFAAIGGITLTTVAGAGSTDIAADNDALNTTTYAAQGAGDLTRGIQVFVNTTGFENLVLSFDQRNSNTASAWTALQYTLDGETWTTATTFQMTTGGSFVNNRSFDFSGVLGANDNPNFGFQILSTFAPGTSTYVGTAGNYGSAGTIRYDMLTLSGDVITAVPEPQSVALLLAGLAVVGTTLRRRSA
jgi:hypothetical protein